MLVELWMQIFLYGGVLFNSQTSYQWETFIWNSEENAWLIISHKTTKKRMIWLNQ